MTIVLTFWVKKDLLTETNKFLIFVILILLQMFDRNRLLGERERYREEGGQERYVEVERDRWNDVLFKVVEVGIHYFCRSTNVEVCLSFMYAFITSVSLSLFLLSLSLSLPLPLFLPLSLYPSLSP